MKASPSLITSYFGRYGPKVEEILRVMAADIDRMLAEIEVGYGSGAPMNVAKGI